MTVFRTARGASALVVLAGVVAAAALAARESGTHGVPTSPLWVADDLPELPPAADNGWVALANFAAGADVEPPEVVMDVVTMVSMEEVDDDTWEMVREYKIPLHDGLRRPDVVRQLDAWHAAAQHELFVDACGLGGQCHYFTQFQLGKLARAEVIDHMARGEWDDALERASDLLRMQCEQRDSARNSMAATVGTAGLGETLTITTLLASRLETLRRCPDVSGLRAEVEACVFDSGLPGQVIIGAYLWSRGVVDLVAAAEDVDETLGDTHWVPNWRHNASWTYAHLDEAFEALHAYADDPSLAVPQPQNPGLECAVLNPIGYQLADALDPRVLLPGQMARLHEDGIKADLLREQLLARLDATCPGD